MLFINGWMENGCCDLFDGMSWAQDIVFQGIVQIQSKKQPVHWRPK